MKRRVFAFAMLVVLVGVTGVWADPVQQQTHFKKNGNTAGANFVYFAEGATPFYTSITNIASLTISAPGPGVVIFNASGFMSLRAHTNGERDEIRCSISSQADTEEVPFSELLVPASAPTEDDFICYGVPIGLTKAVTVSAAGDVTGFLNCQLIVGGGGHDPFVQKGQMTAIFLPIQY